MIIFVPHSGSSEQGEHLQENCLFMLYEKFSNKDYMNKFFKNFSIENLNLDILKKPQDKKISFNFDQKNLNTAEKVYEKFFD